jgi:hypothetical protein
LPHRPLTPSDATQGASRGPRRPRWLLATVVGAAVLLVGGAVTAVLVWRAHPYPLDLVAESPQIEYRLLDQAAQSEADNLRVLAESAEDMISGYAGGHLPSLTIMAAADEEQLAQALSEERGISRDEALGVLQAEGWSAWNRSVFVDLSQGLDYPRSYFWMAAQIADAYKWSPLMNADPIQCIRVPDREVWPVGPTWFHFGAPDYMGMQAYFDSGYWALTNQGAPREEQARIVAAAYAGTSVSLRGLRSIAPWNDSPDPQVFYDLSYAAVSVLVDRAGMRAPFEYWQRLADGECWDEAFQHSFGLTVDDFYSVFEAERPVEPAA